MARNSIQKFDQRAQIASTPDYVVGGGELAQVLTALGGNVAGRLKQMADAAIQKQENLGGQAYGQQQGNANLDRLLAIDAAKAEGSAKPLRGDIDALVVAAANRHGVSADTLRMIAGIESSGNPAAKNPTSSAGGLFQFTDGTAADYGLSDRYDPAQASDAAARLLKNNAAYLARQLGRQPTSAELYLAHQQGAGGATALLNNPGARAADIVGADAVTLNGGSADMTAGQFAQIWLTKAGQVPSKPLGAGGPAIQPLALRNDGTMGGEAFDAAAIRTYGDRMMTGVTTELSAAFEEYRDNPAGWTAALEDIKARYSADDNFGDPRVRDYFDKVFYENARSFSMQIAASQEQRVLAEERAALGENLQAQRTSLSQQAMLLGSNPAAEEVLGGQTQRLLSRIDTAVATNHMTPAEAADQKAAINQELAYSRTEGVFNSLPTPSAKQQFANELVSSWENGDPLLSNLSQTQIAAFAVQLGAKADAAQSKLVAQSVGETARIQGILESDVQSVRESGQEVDIRAQGVTPDRLAILGLNVTGYVNDKRRAYEEWTVTQGMAGLPAGDIDARVATLRPVPGTPDYQRRSELYQLALSERERVLKQRAEDPLAQAHQAGLVELGTVDPGSPDSLALRKQQAQAVSMAYGTPVTYFRPEERSAMTAALYAQPELMPGFALGISQTFGAEASKALSEISDAGPELAYAAGITTELGDNGIMWELSRVIAGRRDKTINVAMPSSADMATASSMALGSAFAGNPEARSAVVNVASILFEGQAAAMGFDAKEVDEAGSPANLAWERAVNRALGARTIDGAQYGGLVSVNGWQTVAPAKMQAERLQTLMSTFNAGDMARLPPIAESNGIPVSPWLLRSAKLVAVGDGLYQVALGDPAGLEPQFLFGTDGKRWVLDASVLNDRAPITTPQQYGDWLRQQSPFAGAGQ